MDETAGYLNEFFTGIGTRLANAHKASWEYYGETVQGLAENITTVEEVSKLCKGIEVMKASGMDLLSAKICKDAFLVLVHQLTYLFNCSLDKAIYPDKWKVAKVIPLFKGGNRDDVSNYRPVSLLPLPGKLLERVVHMRITKFWEEKQFLTEHQWGMRKGFLKVVTILDLTDDLYNQINQGNTTLAEFIDLKKAFDTVNLEILKKKLDKLGIRNKTLDWCSSYLSNRYQCTYANGVTSDLLPVTCGVPQGSVLGPLFFLVVVNDALDFCGVKLYADDTVLYRLGINSWEVAEKPQRSITRFSKWCEENSLTINIAKTKIMSFGSRHNVKKAKNVIVKLGNDKLQQVPSYKYLGMLLDSTLNYNLHVNQVIRTVLDKLLLLTKMKKYLRDNTATCIYKSMLLPYLDYADVVFDGALNKDISKLQKVQDKCLKVCLGKDRRYSIDAKYKLVNVPFLKDRRQAHMLNFMVTRKSKVHLLNNRERRTRAHDAPLFETSIPRCLQA